MIVEPTNFIPRFLRSFEIWSDNIKCAELLNDEGIIRNRLKIKAAVQNSSAFLKIQKEYGSFDRYIWGFTDGKVVYESCDIRTTSPLDNALVVQQLRTFYIIISADDFWVEAVTIIYSYLQAVGIINGHEKDCDFM